MSARKSGLTLLEVLIALALLGLGAAAWVGLLGQSMHAVRAVHARDAEMRAAGEQLARAAVWSSADFASRVGRRGAGAFIMVVNPITPSLYEVTVADTVHGAALLATTFYVRDSSAAASR